MNEDYLAHHGVIGQRWGVRRYQNRDGSLTALGRKHRGYSDKTVGSELKKAGKQIEKAAVKKYKAHQEKKAQKEKELEKAKVKARKEAAEKQAKKAVEDEEKFKKYLREHPREIYKNRDKLSREDLEKIMSDIEWDRKCKDISIDEYKRGLQRVKDFKDGIQAGADLMGSGINAYNNMATIYNAFVDEKTGGKKLKKLSS